MTKQVRWKLMKKDFYAFANGDMTGTVSKTETGYLMQLTGLGRYRNYGEAKTLGKAKQVIEAIMVCHENGLAVFTMPQIIRMQELAKKAQKEHKS